MVLLIANYRANSTEILSFILIGLLLEALRSVAAVCWAGPREAPWCGVAWRSRDGLCLLARGSQLSVANLLASRPG